VAGHVFVVHGDLRQLNCDAWLLPCGATARPGREWLEHLAERAPRLELPARTAEWIDKRQRAMRFDAAPAELPRPWLVHVGGGGRPIGWFVEGVDEFLRRATDDVASQPPRFGRAKHLLALPVVGTGAGGARKSTGDVVRALLPVLRLFAIDRDVDLALVTNEERTYAAAQAQRAADESAWPDLEDPALTRAATRLSRLARRGELTLFLGAGVSMGAGLPSWDALLARLARDAGMSAAEREALPRLHPLDQARIVELRLEAQGHADEPRALGRVVTEALAKSHGYGLSHALLAALPVDEVVTTNYDALFERASRAIGREVSVLPHAPRAGGKRWILKMHGCVTDADHIVLTREDYLRYDHRRQALAAIVQALLITRHMLFVGFSLKDDNFHRIADAVRRARVPAPAAEKRAPSTAHRDRFGTALDLVADPLAQELWAGDLEWLSMEPAPAAGSTAEPLRAAAARRLEVFLDHLGARAGGTTAHLLDSRYDGVLSEAERRLRTALTELLHQVGEHPEIESAHAWQHLDALLRRLGWSGARPRGR
jgi:hypothetical protein